jgi:hypothetical protein
MSKTMDIERVSTQESVKFALRKLGTQESVKFALRKLEDIQFSEAAALSGATKLSRVLSDLQCIQKKLVQIDRVIMHSQADWEKNDDTKVQKSMMELEDVSKHTETAILLFMNKVGSIKPAPLPFISFKIDCTPVDFFALHKLKADIREIKSQVGRINIKDLGEPNMKSITRRSIRNADEIWFLGLEMHWKCILQRVLDRSLKTRCVIQVVGTEIFANTVLMEKIYQRFCFKSCILKIYKIHHFICLNN